jgi:hypothetical protein
MSEADESNLGDSLEMLRDAWGAEANTPFDVWVRMVSEAFLASSLDLQPAARLLDTTAAELDAALRLATLEDETLTVLAAGTAPPRTTWYALAGASLTGIRAGLAALETLSLDEPASIAVEHAVRTVEGPSPLERVAALGGPVFGHMARKAKRYNLLRPQSRKFLVDIAIRRGGGKTLTEKQAAYALNVLTDLVDGGAVRSPSPDGDQDICDEVLRALARDACTSCRPTSRSSRARARNPL